LAKKPKRKKIKPNRKPKTVRDRSWKKEILRGDIEDDPLFEFSTERVVPKGREEERVNLWTKLEREVRQAPDTRADGSPVSSDWKEGVVVRVSTSTYDVDLGEQTVLCGVRGSLSATQTGYTNVVAVGDRVLVSLGQADHGIIEKVLPRRSLLARPDVLNPDLGQVVVSNVDQMLIVAAWEEPRIWFELIDRYLIAAAQGRMKPLVCLNKIDLAEDPADYHTEMSPYQDLGYTVLFTSALTGEGIAELRTHLAGEATVVTGRSGVGKSSLLMAVEPELDLRVEEVSYYSGEGKHTTAQVSLLKLTGGGYVVDTPGIRELGLITVHRHELVLYFPEITALAGACRFGDCSHTHEPGCAVVKAVEEGKIPWSRYASYQTIYESLPEYYTE